MIRWGLRALLLALLFVAVGWLSTAAAFEFVRVAAGVLLGVSFALLIVGYVRTPQPPEA